ncbi:conserved hypothetical protein [Neospora caninum Liverpool]|uniref:GYF domain-containing protein n=1 Tax=Neospora caninum (strain Liverpool) TaxID=572307 RepID=F0VNW8_NEOCL|nr:conserved hypothetical protein [Neospora caninum Liverpool]CBZ55414.1 conserved hypothetical protein [Neospora caninum Liverpool]CEL70150.1 TPA: hypothetical protein BN1204_058370 [Neospora caninum Liverpool]|eukprot:XP_003885442.1 conserved hypothetical protein [Neospora caninum Liverpool]
MFNGLQPSPAVGLSRPCPRPPAPGSLGGFYPPLPPYSSLSPPPHPQQLPHGLPSSHPPYPPPGGRPGALPPGPQPFLPSDLRPAGVSDRFSYSPPGAPAGQNMEPAQRAVHSQPPTRAVPSGGRPLGHATRGPVGPSHRGHAGYELAFDGSGFGQRSPSPLGPPAPTGRYPPWNETRRGLEEDAREGRGEAGCPAGAWSRFRQQGGQGEQAVDSRRNLHSHGARGPQRELGAPPASESFHQGAFRDGPPPSVGPSFRDRGPQGSGHFFTGAYPRGPGGLEAHSRDSPPSPAGGATPFAELSMPTNPRRGHPTGEPRGAIPARLQPFEARFAPQRGSFPEDAERGFPSRRAEDRKDPHERLPDARFGPPGRAGASRLEFGDPRNPYYRASAERGRSGEGSCFQGAPDSGGRHGDFDRQGRERSWLPQGPSSLSAGLGDPGRYDRLDAGRPPRGGYEPHRGRPEPEAMHSDGHSSRGHDPPRRSPPGPDRGRNAPAHPAQEGWGSEASGQAPAPTGTGSVQHKNEASPPWGRDRGAAERPDGRRGQRPVREGSARESQRVSTSGGAPNYLGSGEACLVADGGDRPERHAQGLPPHRSLGPSGPSLSSPEAGVPLTSGFSHGTELAPAAPPGPAGNLPLGAFLGGASLAVSVAGTLPSLGVGGGLPQPALASFPALPQGTQQHFFDALRHAVTAGAGAPAARSPFPGTGLAGTGAPAPDEGGRTVGPHGPTEKEKSPEVDKNIPAENPNDSRLLRELSKAPPELLNPETSTVAHNWWYLDNKNKCQGPFDTLRILRWFEGGYFDSQRPFRRDDEAGFTPLDDGKRITDVAARIVNLARTSQRAAAQRSRQRLPLGASVPLGRPSGEMTLEAKVQQAQAALAPLFHLAKKRQDRPDIRFATLGKRRRLV